MSLFGRLMRIYGHSMSPVLNPGELVLVRPNAFDARAPRRGEIVAVRPAAFEGQALVKRVVGLPGERVAVEGREWTLGDEEFFLLGDRTEDSCDSRILGPVSRQELVGPVTVRLWPWTVLTPADSTP